MPSDRDLAPRATLRRRACLAAIGAVVGASAVAACQMRPTVPVSSPTTAPPAAAAPTETAVPPTAEGATPTVASTPSPLPPTPTAVATPTPAPRALTWWTVRSDDPWLKASQEATSRFNRSHPAIDAKPSGGHADFGRIVGALSSGQAPDVVEPGAFAGLAARGIIRPLDTYLGRGGVDPARYFEPMWKNGAWRGKPYGIPALDHGPELGLIWNTSLLAGAPPSTTNDLYQFARRLTRQDPAGAIQFLGFDPLDGVGGLLDTARDVVGQDWINAQSRGVQLSTPPYQAFLAGLSAYYAAIGADHLNDFRQATSPMTDANDSALNLGKQGAILTGYWSVAEVARLAKDAGWKFESTWAPTMAGSTTVQRLGGLVLTMPVVAKQPDDGWELIQHLASDETSAIFLNTVGTFAATRSFVNAGSWKKYPGLTFWIDSLSQASRLTSRSENSVASLAQERWTQAITDVLVNNKSPSDALNAAQSAIQAELNKLPNA